ncbi:hypothetical protein HOD71_04440 [Candidatus Peribacteria bacterium]|nr:hypothetical protein [Candidatus Peribacteria bacterium]
MSYRIVNSALVVLLMVSMWTAGYFTSYKLSDTAKAQVPCVCGDGKTVKNDTCSEYCDDGNAIEGDGCSPNCQTECGDCEGVIIPCYDAGEGSWSSEEYGGYCNNNPPYTTQTCFITPGSCGNEKWNCSGGDDEDGDGFTDCADPDCAGDILCGGTETDCADHLDNDNDELWDCEDTDCASDPACGGGGGACGGGGGNPCEDEDVCGDGRITGIEECDVGGICTGSNREGYNGRHCFDLDPTDYRFYGVQRCVATGGTCVPRGGHGCTADCLEECYTNSVPCFTDDDCGDCVEGVCVGGICQEVSTAAVCGNWVKEGTEECDDGNAIDGDGCSSMCLIGESCDDFGGCVMSPCATSAKKWQITFSGIQNNACNLCTTLNTTIELLEGVSEDHCSNCDHCWVAPELCDDGTGAKDRLYLSYDGNDWVLVYKNKTGAGEEDEILYIGTGATWNCNGVNTMSWIGTTEFDSCVWPEEDITVTPLGEIECTDYGWP